MFSVRLLVKDRVFIVKIWGSQSQTEFLIVEGVGTPNPHIVLGQLLPGKEPCLTSLGGLSSLLLLCHSTPHTHTCLRIVLPPQPSLPAPQATLRKMLQTLRSQKCASEPLLLPFTEGPAAGCTRRHSEETSLHTLKRGISGSQAH